MCQPILQAFGPPLVCYHNPLHTDTFSFFLSSRHQLSSSSVSPCFEASLERKRDFSKNFGVFENFLARSFIWKKKTFSSKKTYCTKSFSVSSRKLFFVKVETPKPNEMLIVSVLFIVIWRNYAIKVYSNIICLVLTLNHLCLRWTSNPSWPSMCDADR